MPFLNRKFQSIIIFILSIVLYANTWQHGYVLDDTDLILNNSQVKQGTASILTIFTSKYRDGSQAFKNELYRPLSKSLLALEWQLAPANPFLGHVVNTFLYAIICLLVFRILSLIFREKSSLAFLTTLLFATHPVHTEVVANIKSCDELLSLLNLLVSLLFFHKYKGQSKKNQLMLSLFFFTLSLFSKESAVAFVFIFPIFSYFTSTNTIKIKAVIIESLPFLVPVFFFLLCRNAVLGDYEVSRTIGKIDNYLISLPNGTLRLANALYLQIQYVRLFFFPFVLLSDYSLQSFPIVKLTHPLVLSSLIILLILIRHIRRKLSEKQVWLFGLLFFLISFSITSNIFFLIGTSFAERLLFTPSLGLCILLTGALSLLKEEKFGKIIFASVVILSVVFSVLTFIRNESWESNLSIMKADVSNNPKSARLHFNYAMALRNEIVDKKNSLAIQNNNLPLIEFHLKEALKIYPEYGSAYYSLGEYYLHRQKYNEALVMLQQARFFLPRAKRVYLGLAACMSEKKEFDSSLYFINEGMRYTAGGPDFSYQKATLFEALGQKDSAKVYYQRTLELNSHDSLASSALKRLR